MKNFLNVCRKRDGDAAAAAIKRQRHQRP